MRVIADHARATAFLIADGVQPSNEGRGYVLRRIMRRAIRHGSLLGLDEPFLHEVGGPGHRAMGGAYPELRENRAFIARGVPARGGALRRHARPRPEADRRGVAEVGRPGASASPATAFLFLYDTYGFPVDLTEEIIAASAASTSTDARYEALDDEQRAARRGRLGSAEGGETVYYRGCWRAGPHRVPRLRGRGHEGGRHRSRILEAPAPRCPRRAGDEVEVVLDRTPFYGESGGQIGDTGTSRAGGGKAEVRRHAATGAAGLIVHR